MSVRTIVADIIHEFAEAGVATSPRAVEESVRAHHPDVYADYADMLAAKAIRGIARDVLTSAARARQTAFEGMELPQWFTVERPDGFTFVPLKSATLADHDADVEVKRRNSDAARTELLLARARSRQLRSVPGAHDGLLVIDAVAMLTKQAAA